MRRQRVSRIDCALAFLVLVLGGLLVVAPLQKQEAGAVKLDREIALEKRAAERTVELLQQLDSLTSMRSIIERRSIGATFTRLVAEITQLIPDDAYLLELSVSHKEITIIGYAQAASGVISLLGESALFGEAKFLSPITRDQQSGREHFHIAVPLRGA
jgi:general secretion pathway protein L